MPIIQVDETMTGTKLPRLQGEQGELYIGSPMAVIGLFLFALRERLRHTGTGDLPWVWTGDLGGESEEPRKVLIDSVYNVKRGTRNYRPAIYVGRGGGLLQPLKQKIGNKVGVQFKTGMQAYHTMANMPITIECESETAGESSALGELVWGFILSTRDLLRADFGLHEVSEPVMSDTLPETLDKEIWTTTVQFTVSFDSRWGTTPIAPILRDMYAKFNQADDGDFLRTLAVRDGD